MGKKGRSHSRKSHKSHKKSTRRKYRTRAMSRKKRSRSKKCRKTRNNYKGGAASLGGGDELVEILTQRFGVIEQNLKTHGTFSIEPLLFPFGHDLEGEDLRKWKEFVSKHLNFDMKALKFVEDCILPKLHEKYGVGFDADLDDLTEGDLRGGSNKRPTFSVFKIFAVLFAVLHVSEQAAATPTFSAKHCDVYEEANHGYIYSTYPKAECLNSARKQHQAQLDANAAEHRKIAAEHRVTETNATNKVWRRRFVGWFETIDDTMILSVRGIVMLAFMMGVAGLVPVMAAAGYGMLSRLGLVTGAVSRTAKLSTQTNAEILEMVTARTELFIKQQQADQLRAAMEQEAALNFGGNKRMVQDFMNHATGSGNLGYSGVNRRNGGFSMRSAKRRASESDSAGASAGAGAGAGAGADKGADASASAKRVRFGAGAGAGADKGADAGAGAEELPPNVPTHQPFSGHLTSEQLRAVDMDYVHRLSPRNQAEWWKEFSSL